MADHLATLRAIDDAFTAEVARLFGKLTEVMAEIPERHDDNLAGTEKYEMAVRAFDRGLNAARAARDLVRHRFTEDGRKPGDA